MDKALHWLGIIIFSFLFIMFFQMYLSVESSMFIGFLCGILVNAMAQFIGTNLAG